MTFLAVIHQLNSLAAIYPGRQTYCLEMRGMRAKGDGGEAGGLTRQAQR
jgi:hypothetical protein